MRRDGKSWFAPEYLLHSLSPFVLRGEGENKAVLEDILENNWKSVHTLWKDDRQKSAEERAAGNVNFSNRWIEDRGDKKLAANNNNWRQAA